MKKARKNQHSTDVHNEIYSRKASSNFSILIALLTALLIISAALALRFGAVNISFSDVYSVLLNRLIGYQREGIEQLMASSSASIIWKIRLPRVLLGIFVGTGLSLCGAVMQATVQNPLAEPYILGISSGASLGATIAVFFGASFSLLSSGKSMLAFIGALAATGAVLSIASMGGKMTSSKLILSGTVVNAICTAFSNFIISIAGDSEATMTIKFWTLGSLTRANWSNIALPICAVVIGCVFFLTQYRNLNTMLVGDEAATTLGINLSFYRKMYMLVSSILIGVLVSTCGVIGFVGLVIPHISRALVGADHRRLLPITVLFGGIFFIWADVIARIVIPNGELAIGIVTSMIGAPFFAYILIRRHYSFGS